MTDQIHKRFTDEEVKRLLERYAQKEVNRKYRREVPRGAVPVPDLRRQVPDRLR